MSSTALRARSLVRGQSRAQAVQGRLDVAAAHVAAQPVDLVDGHVEVVALGVVDCRYSLVDAVLGEPDEPVGTGRCHAPCGPRSRPARQSAKNCSGLAPLGALGRRGSGLLRPKISASVSSTTDGSTVLPAAVQRPAFVQRALAPGAGCPARAALSIDCHRRGRHAALGQQVRQALRLPADHDLAARARSLSVAAVCHSVSTRLSWPAVARAGREGLAQRVRVLRAGVAEDQRVPATGQPLLNVFPGEVRRRQRPPAARPAAVMSRRIGIGLVAHLSRLGLNLGRVIESRRRNRARNPAARPAASTGTGCRTRC